MRCLCSLLEGIFLNKINKLSCMHVECRFDRLTNLRKLQEAYMLRRLETIQPNSFHRWSIYALSHRKSPEDSQPSALGAL